MDIAAIRKKAKAQTREETLPAESEKLQKAPELERQNEVDAESVKIAEEDAPESVVVKHSLAAQNVVAEQDRLDLLFAVPEEFALVMDESFVDSLDKQGSLQGQSSRQYLSFCLGSEEYALDIKRISEIIKLRELTDIPRTPEFVLGIISLRGVVVPVYDLCRRLNLGKSNQTSASRIVVCQSEDVTIGFLVDSINQVVNLVDDDIEPPPGVLSGLDREMLSGIGRCQGRMIILLNLTSVLAVEALS